MKNIEGRLNKLAAGGVVIHFHLIPRGLNAKD